MRYIQCWEGKEHENNHIEKKLLNKIAVPVSKTVKCKKERRHLIQKHFKQQDLKEVEIKPQCDTKETLSTFNND